MKPNRLIPRKRNVARSFCFTFLPSGNLRWTSRDTVCFIFDEELRREALMSWNRSNSMLDTEYLLPWLVVVIESADLRSCVLLVKPLFTKVSSSASRTPYQTHGIFSEFTLEKEKIKTVKSLFNEWFEWWYFQNVKPHT